MAIDRTQYNLLVDDSGAGIDGTVWDKNKVKVVVLDPIDQNGVLHDATFNDGVSHNLASVPNLSGRIVISATGPITTVIPFYANGGSGVAFKWTFLDPDTGWSVNTNGTFSFTDASALNTYTVGFGGGTGVATIQRTAGATAFRVLVISDPTP